MMRDALVPLLETHLSEFSGGFQWGARDCVTFAAGWVEKVTGQKLIPENLSWGDQESAALAMAQMGCADAAELAGLFLTSRPRSFARLGDIVSRDVPGFGVTLGICLGADVAFVRIGGGFNKYALSRCDLAWTVG
jgi:hypothetical protein